MTTLDVNVVVMDFKNSKSKEMVTSNSDGSYTIFINAKFSYDTQLKAYEHAMKHIHENDFEKKDVQNIEFEAHSSAEIIPIPAKDFSDKIKEIQKRRRRTQRQMKKNEERVKFLMEHYDMAAIAEHQYLYGDDL